jgi:hypothetical protein
MINSKTHMKLLTWLFLLSPAWLPASSVQYTLDNGNRELISLIAPRFLTDMPFVFGNNGNPTWPFVRPQLATSICDDYTRIFKSCNISFIQTGAHQTDIATLVTAWDLTVPAFDPLAHPIFAIGLGDLGSAKMSNYTFTISQTDAAPTYAPEPQTWAMMFAALALISWYVRSKQAAAFHNQSARDKQCLP